MPGKDEIMLDYFIENWARKNCQNLPEPTNNIHSVRDGTNGHVETCPGVLRAVVIIC